MYTYGIGNFSFGLAQIERNQAAVAQSLERLSTGKQINRASDDPSGIIAVNEHQARIYSIESELKSYTRQESYLGAKEGGLSVVSDQLAQLNGLIVNAANQGANSETDQQATQSEINSILKSIDTIASTTTFNGQQILSEYKSSSISSGNYAHVHAEEHTLNDLADLAFKDPELAQQIAQDAVDHIARKRGAIGNQLNEIDSQRNVLEEELINLSDSLSSIEDVDYAKETSNLIRAQILETASIKAAQISRESASQVLSLLENATDTIK